MMLSENLKYLRALKGIYQREIAADLTIIRGRNAKYDEALSEPPIENLLKLCHYHQISIDALVTTDLKNLKYAFTKKNNYVYSTQYKLNE